MKTIIVHFDDEKNNREVFTKIVEYKITHNQMLYMKNNRNYEFFCSLQHVLYFTVSDVKPIPVVNI